MSKITAIIIKNNKQQNTQNEHRKDNLYGPAACQSCQSKPASKPTTNHARKPASQQARKPTSKLQASRPASRQPASLQVSKGASDEVGALRYLHKNKWYWVPHHEKGQVWASAIARPNEHQICPTFVAPHLKNEIRRHFPVTTLE